MNVNDMLAALQSAARQLEARVDPLQVAQQIRAAIAKAEGGHDPVTQGPMHVLNGRHRAPKTEGTS
jgi:hypothetical protein